jgi:hypothetical protein
MAEENKPTGLAQDLLRIHRVITRGITVTLARGDEYLRTGFPELGIRTGFTDYAKSLTIVLDAHHLGEDQIAFPALKDKITSAPYERLSRHHQEIVALLEPVSKAIPAIAERGDRASLTALVGELRKIYDIWRPHIQTEETYFSQEALAAVMSPEEQGRISGSMAKHSQEHATPGYLSLPFVLFNLDAEDRAVMAASMPAMVVEELIPKAWKEQWAPMKPFLLE